MGSRQLLRGLSARPAEGGSKILCRGISRDPLTGQPGRVELQVSVSHAGLPQWLDEEVFTYFLQFADIGGS